MKPRRIDLVVAARPNFVKAAPVLRALDGRGACTRLIHTGQHYSLDMSDRFFQELGLRAPDVMLGVGSGSNTEQIARTMTALEGPLKADPPDLVVVFGDVNAVPAAALVASELGIRVAHVEAGLRSFDRRMQEEVNRVVADALSSLLFTTCRDATDNLVREGIAEERVFFVGNVMIDTLVDHLEGARRLAYGRAHGLAPGGYGLVTLHRPSNVDTPAALERLCEAIDAVQRLLPLIFPVHPRTERRLADFGMGARLAAMSGLRRIPPCGYVEFLSLLAGARVVLTDSGGIQEETTFLGVPCLTLRENTERPITVASGTNALVGTSAGAVRSSVERVLAGDWKRGSIPEGWDGKAATRIADVLAERAD